MPATTGRHRFNSRRLHLPRQAAVPQLPILVPLHEHCADQAQDARLIGEGHSERKNLRRPVA